MINFVAHYRVSTDKQGINGLGIDAQREAVNRRRPAVLLIARLDRLARNVAFISNLMESDVEFVAVDSRNRENLRSTF